MNELQKEITTKQINKYTEETKESKKEIAFGMIKAFVFTSLSLPILTHCQDIKLDFVERFTELNMNNPEEAAFCITTYGGGILITCALLSLIQFTLDYNKKIKLESKIGDLKYQLSMAKAVTSEEDAKVKIK